MDALFDAADAIMSRLRRRFPVALLVLTTLIWLLLNAMAVFIAAHSGAWQEALLLMVPAIVLALVVARRGLHATSWLWWGLGAGWLIVLAGALPLAAAGMDANGWVYAVAGFTYGQIYFVIIAILDHLWIMRHGGTEPAESTRFRLRRQLQVRLLLATFVAVGGIAGAARIKSYDPETYAYDPVLPYGIFLCCGLPMFLPAAWFRWRPLAWIPACLIAVIYLANLIPGSARSRQEAIVQYGWASLVAVYLWVKAARVWYWPMAWPLTPVPPSPPPGYQMPYPPPPHAQATAP